MSNTDEIPVGAVLSDEDIKTEMGKAKKAGKAPLVGDEKGEPLNFDEQDQRLLSPSCVDLRVGRIYIGNPEAKQGYHEIRKEGDIWPLAPGAIAHIESREVISTPSDIMGLLIPKNRKSEEGLLMLNAGHVDPNWVGFLTAEVMNVTAQDYTIEIGKPLFSVVFQYLRTLTTRLPTLETDEERRSRARSMVSKRPTSLHTYYRDILIKEVEKTFLPKAEYEAKRLRGWTIAGLIFGAVAALTAVIGLAFLFWQLAN